MNNEDKVYLGSLDGFLNAVSIIKSPNRNKFYGARLYEGKSLYSDLTTILSLKEDEIKILTKTKRDIDLKWLYFEIENELSGVNEQIKALLLDNIIYYFENLFEEQMPLDVIEYCVFVKLIDPEIDYYCEFEEKLYLFQLKDDVMILSISDRKCPVRSLKEPRTS